MFLKPRVQDLEATREILGVFGEISGLSVSYSKSLAIVIKGEPQETWESFHANIWGFSCHPYN
jgi:hypothetical protein